MIKLILISVASVWFTDMSNIPQVLKWWLCKKRIWYNKVVVELQQHDIMSVTYTERSIKPFDCVKCLSFWLSIIYLSINHYQVVDTILYSCSVSALSIILSKIYNHDYGRAL